MVKPYGFDRKILWSTVSKNKYVNSPNVYVIIQESVASSKAATAEWIARKPDWWKAPTMSEVPDRPITNNHSGTNGPTQ